MRRALSHGAQGALAALAAASLWALVDGLSVCVRLEAGAPVRLVLFALVISGGLALALGATVGLLTSLRRGAGPATARALAGGAGFAVWGLAVVGVAVNRSLLPSRWHPLSIAVNLALLALLLGLGWAIGRPVRSRGGVRLLAATVATSWLGAIGLAWSLGASVPPSVDHAPAGAGRGPNLLMVVIDSLRAEESQVTTLMPALAAVDGAGVSFTRAYAQSSWTKPSVATLFTGLHPLTHGAVGRGDVLARDFTTLPEILADVGYRTAVFSSNPWVSPAFGFAQGVDTFRESDPGGDPTRLLAIVRTLQLVARTVPGADASRALRAVRLALGLDLPERSNCVRDDEITAPAIEWLRTAPQPFFGYVHYMSAHSPYEPPGPRRIERARQLAAQHGEAALSPDETVALREEYLAALGHADAVLGRLLAALEERGLAGGTIVAVTADHGEELGEHGQFGHGKSLYGEVVHVPLLIRLPGRIAAGQRVDVPIGGVDLFRLLLELIRAPGTEGSDGLPALLRADGRSDPAARAPVHLSLTLEGGFAAGSLVTADYQYIETTPHLGGAPRQEFYDLRRDPSQRTNLWPAGPADGLALAQTLHDLEQATARGVAPKIALSADTDQRLRTLGYVQ